MSSTADWRRLDPRMLLVYPVKELVRFLPVLIGLFIAGTASGGAGEWWNAVGVLIPVGLGVLRYWTTFFRIAGGRIELRRGLVNRHVLSTPLDRVRSVDITAPPVHRLLGLTSVRVGTGTASTDDDEQLVLDGLPVEQARELRADLLGAGPAPEVDVPEAAPVLVLDPSWVRFAPFTSAGLALAGGVLAVASQALNTVGGFQRLDPDRIAHDAEAWSPWVAVPAALAGLVVVVSVLSIGGYVVTNWGFALTHAGGAWHLRRGLLTTRETTIDDARLRGVAVGEPLGLRLAGGGRASAIATGLGRGQSALLVPPAPRDVVHRAAGAVLRTPGPLDVALVAHGPRARTRRYTRAVGPAVLVLLAAVAVVPLLDAPLWLPVLAALGVPAAAALAADRVRALGHALVGGYVVVRSGSLDRRREALETDGVIGWNLRATWFQRRAGLTTLVATTAGGRQAVTALDVPEPAAVALAREAHPDMVGQFLEEEPVRTSR
ncbi:PH domain-containing protein [Nocardioides sp. URHA0032]|uniref:PH domain-containing protein n=1 Tax=Nocardioides sp. URHA0032 TaxID=1380388 RepID=UPI0005695BA8|nr:PH domain-containing protein [Nocardioides sp. URHA0032]